MFAAILPAGFMVVSLPFWSHSLVAEVYTLHTLLTCLVLFLLLCWGEKKDFRYLYSAALTYGVNAGNHATAAFFLPAILLLFFLWIPKPIREEKPASHPVSTGRHLATCIMFFLLGLSVYAYLPVRSYAEPSFDWGNPETLEGFLFQVTDRKDAHTHFSVLKDSLAVTGEPQSTLNRLLRHATNIWQMVWALLSDVQIHLSPVSAIGFVAGAFLCFKKSRALFAFFMVFVAGNVSFFVHWRKESFFPSYLVVSMFTSVAIYYLLREIRDPGEASSTTQATVNWRRLVWTGLFLIIPWTALMNFYKVDRSQHYLAETLTKKIYLALPNNAIFIPGISWFNYYYAKDVQRLRDDVTSVSSWDLLSENPPSWVTTRRFPTLDLPDPAQYAFATRQNISDYSRELFERNAMRRPIILEQNETIFEQTDLTSMFKPYRNVLLRFDPIDTEASTAPSHAWAEFLNFMEEDVGKTAGADNIGWLTLPYFLIYSAQMYYHDTHRYVEEREVLQLMHEFLGKREADWQLKMADSLVLDGRLDEARPYWEVLKTTFPDSSENWMAQGLLARAEGDKAGAIEYFSKSAVLRPDDFRPHLELAEVYHHAGEAEKARSELDTAYHKIKNLREWQKVKKVSDSQVVKLGDPSNNTGREHGHVQQ